jgi:hypothetical protein
MCSLIIVYATASSTPVMAVCAAALGGAMFVLRKHMQLVRIASVMLLVLLAIVMQMPVWYLVTKFSPVGSSAAWFRGFLIDRAIFNIGEWWLAGTASTAHWGWGMQDVTCQYVLEGVSGGLLTLGLFVATIYVAFCYAGQLWRKEAGDKYRLAMSWALGVTIFVHSVTFIALSYFGQMVFLWYLHLAMVASMSSLKTGICGFRERASGERPMRGTVHG